MRLQLGTLDILMILLITVGPLKAAIVFSSMTAKADTAFRRAVAIKTVSTATIVVLLFAVFGEFMLKVFHVSLPALKLAGGLILVLFAISMVLGAGHDDEPKVAANPSMDIAIYPLAMPLMATPQGIVAIVTIAAAAATFGDTARLLILLVAIMALNLATLLAAEKIIKAIGAPALVITGRIVGILLAALAMQLMISALRDLGALPPLPH
jgi:multiple antibiotic resistance protein